MFSEYQLIFVALIWIAILFGTALWAEKRSVLLEGYWHHIYSLSLAVYCTSWTFYGTVTQALHSGWPIPPTFIGSILFYVFAFSFMRKLLSLVQEHNATSIADLIASRLGRDSALAAIITAVAVIGIVPYIALQLQAITMSYGMLIGKYQPATEIWKDSALYIALVMAAFAMLFGTRSASVSERNRGLVLAIAVESILKLGAMLALGLYVWLNFDMGNPVPEEIRYRGSDGFPALIVLGAFAMFTLPHQFHVGFIESNDARDLRTARWMFPAYMVLIAIPILPLALAGHHELSASGVASDLYVMALPLSKGDSGMALLAFIGGLSAATGMVIFSTLALSVMISNHWLTPIWLKAAWSNTSSDQFGNLSQSLLLARRIGIILLIMLAWGYSRASGNSNVLADIGAVSFSALGTLAPAVGYAVWRPETPARSVLIGLLGSVFIWFWTLLLPVLAEGFDFHSNWFIYGPMSLQWLAPDHFLWLEGWSRLSRSVVLSLLVGSVVPLLHAAYFRPVIKPANETGLNRETLEMIALRFMPKEIVHGLMQEHPRQLTALRKRVNRKLSAVLGANSVRLLFDAAESQQGADLDTVATIVGEASQALRFNQQVLEAALENMTQGISVVDSHLRLVAWNKRYSDLFHYPTSLLKVGVPIEKLLLYNVERGLLGADKNQLEVAKRIAHMKLGTHYITEREFDHCIVEIRGNPMPGGGFVATFTDVTEFRTNEQKLKQVAETLDARVTERTAQLQSAKAEAEMANLAKSRFLAAVSHDLAQPLNAAHLFTHALTLKMQHSQYQESLANIDGALNSAESLLLSVLDISSLDAGGMVPEITDFPVNDILRSLASEFSVLATEKNIVLAFVPCKLWVRSDAGLLRRIVQNFLSNAIRYTSSGKVLFGCRRKGDRLLIQIWDTGPGIADADQKMIFEEFRRLGRSGQGMGLGLAIADRIANMLNHPIMIRSWLDIGSVFSVEVPITKIKLQEITQIQPLISPNPKALILLVDNDAEVLKAMLELLVQWGNDVIAASSIEQALQRCKHQKPNILLFDYHLDQGVTGLMVRAQLESELSNLPCIILTADRSEEVRNDILNNGCQVLHKPIKPLALKTAMANMLPKLKNH